MTTSTTAEGHSDKRSWPRWASRHRAGVPPQADQPTGRDRGADLVGWLAIVSVLLWPVVEAIRIIVQPVHEVVFGDFALFELATRDAWHLEQLLGPSASPGFHHLGPAMFYLLAPAVRLLEPGPGLYLGAVLINAVALAAVAVLIWRRAGSRAALWTAIALNLFCLAVSLDTLRQPWNPLLIITPMLLFVVLWAAAVTRTAGAWLWAAVVGSYEIQTHVTAAVFVAAMLSLAAVWSLVRMWRGAPPWQPRRWWRHWGRLSGFAALALMWVPSTLELFRGDPNNLSLILRWWQAGEGSRTALDSASSIVLRSLAISPPHRTTPILGSLSWWSAPLPASWTKEVAALLVLIASALLVGWLVRRRRGFAAALACAPLLAVPLAVVTVHRAGDADYAYVTGWLAFVPYVALVALGVGLLAPRPSAATRPPPPNTRSRPARPSLNATALLTVMAMAAAGVTVATDLRGRSLASVNEETARATTFVADAKAQLRPHDSWIGYSVASPDAWEVTAAVVLELERLGYHSVVDARQVKLFGQDRTTQRPYSVLFAFYETGDPMGAGGALGSPISAAGDTVMTVWRPPG